MKIPIPGDRLMLVRTIIRLIIRIIEIENQFSQNIPILPFEVYTHGEYTCRVGSTPNNIHKC
jgi:hypothetical protein